MSATRGSRIGGSPVEPAGPPDATYSRLRRFNLLMAAVHLGQSGVMLLLSNDFSLPITTSFLVSDPGERLVPEPETLVDVRIGPLVALFLLLSGLAHLAVASPGIFGWYERNVRAGINPARWIEYSVSASVMIVVIAMLTGIYDVATLIALFALNASMILFGWMMEVHNQTTTRTDWKAFWFGSFAGIVPWIAIGIYLFGAGGDGGGPPGFVYGIFASLFVFFNVFAVNMVLQYRKVGPWRSYLFGERAYIWLSLAAKSALAWQVFAGTLRPS